MILLDFLKSLHWNMHQWRELHLGLPVEGRLKSIGRGCRIARDAHFSHPERVVLGDNVGIGNRFFANTWGGLTIGSNTVISYDCTIWTVNHRFDEGATLLPFDYHLEAGPVTIGECVWIGVRVSIVPGVTIGEGAVVGMGAVVTKDIPPLAIVGGNPARVIGRRDEPTYRRLKEQGRFVDLPQYLHLRAKQEAESEA